ncbi:glutathione S-transferase 1-like isoform X2 [Harmonia axyridis]|uniref:glutathione S-transferase 1-like isoform X2 n=1 Tax=Harmonia axyridis TaxID=115357 RepID=UPI001E276306|nr:glutathione S-transferase 1-like isoform X2 [Harmonia axyridis]
MSNLLLKLSRLMPRYDSYLAGVMAPILYSCELSPPVRSVLLTAKAIGLDLNIQDIDLGKKEQMTPEFLEMNPQHTVPTLQEDDGFVLWDSHAIMPYIVEKYSKYDTFYPTDIKKRAVIHQRMHFDTISSVTRSEAINPLFHDNKTSIPENLVATIKTHYNFLEKILERSEWIACDSVTIADFSLIPSIKTADIIVPIDRNTYPKLSSWLKRAENWKYYDANERGHDSLKNLILERLQS